MNKVTLMMALMGVALAGCGGGGDVGGETAGLPHEDTTSQSSYTFASVAGIPYEVMVMGTLAGDSYAVDINDAGQIVGDYRDGDQVNAFLWEKGQMRLLAPSAHVFGINAEGQAVGWLRTEQGPEAFLYDGQLKQFNRLGGSSRALALNNAGQIVGRWTTFAERAFIRDKDGMDVIALEVNGYATAVDDLGRVAIKELRANGFGALLWSEGELIDLGTFGGESTQILGMNGAGQIVGWSQTAAGAYHAFLWEKGVMTDLGTMGGDSSSAVAINDEGQILVRVSSLDGDRSFLLDGGKIVPLENFGVDYAVVAGLNNLGQIVGWLATETGEFRAFVATPR